MQAVILAAGEGKRMRPLTLTTPKPLLTVAGKPLLEHIIESLPAEIHEVILVIGYRGDLIQEHFGDLYQGRTITYVTQEKAEGTAKALGLVKHLLTGKFLMMFADDIHGAQALAEAIQYPLALMVSHHEDPTRFGVVTEDDEGNMATFVEKPEHPTSNLISTGAMILDQRIFDYQVTEALNGEFFLTDAVAQLAKDHPVKVVEQPEWIALGYPEDLANAEQILESRKPQGELQDLSDEPSAE